MIASQATANIATILLFVILARWLSAQAMGTFRQVLLVYGVAMGLVFLQFDKSMLYFMPTLKPRRQKGFMGKP